METPRSYDSTRSSSHSQRNFATGSGNWSSGHTRIPGRLPHAGNRPPNSNRPKVGRQFGAQKLPPAPLLDRDEKNRLLSKLTPKQYRVTQDKITERPYSNKYYKHWERGVYSCVVCGEKLFTSQTKYDSGSGWPAFFDIIDPNKVHLKQDLSHVGANLLLLVCNPSLARTEVSCATCGAHLGHVFDDGPKPTGKRFCVNSESLDFSPSETGVQKESPLTRKENDNANTITSSKFALGNEEMREEPMVHLASPSNSCSFGARICLRVPNIDPACVASTSQS
ncbi:uncharacterized protein LOC143018950 [Oratosquilla oratoria]|uniref:uncharacterized protein LOC143018950 n=1 Tax=Oratosquilla oratoria TaxID=337810 RepID=UPI003F75A142